MALIEIWKDCVEYDGMYQVSNLGRVKTFRFNKGRILKGTINCHGYRMVCLRKQGVPTKEFVHRLVAKAFIDNPDNKPFINHIDSNPLNNAVDNLEWCTQAENVHHAMNKGRLVSPLGEENGKSKLTANEVLLIRKAWKECGNYCEVGRMFSVNPGTVWAIINGKTWRGVY